MGKIGIGLFGIGLDTYWGQFEGLLDKLCGYQKIISEKLSKNGLEVVDAGMADNPDKARMAAAFLGIECRRVC